MGLGMARGKEITFDKPEALGVRHFAELLSELSAADPVVRRAVRLAPTADQSPAKLLAEIDTSASARSPVPRRSSTGTSAIPSSRNSKTCGSPYRHPRADPWQGG